MMITWRAGQYSEQAAIPQVFGACVIDFGWQPQGTASAPAATSQMFFFCPSDLGGYFAT